MYGVQKHALVQLFPLFQGRASFVCPFGHRLVGSGSIACAATGDWDGKVPKCEGIWKGGGNSPVCCNLSGVLFAVECCSLLLFPLRFMLQLLLCVIIVAASDFSIDTAADVDNVSMTISPLVSPQPSAARPRSPLTTVASWTAADSWWATPCSTSATRGSSSSGSRSSGAQRRGSGRTRRRSVRGFFKSI